MSDPSDALKAARVLRTELPNQVLCPADVPVAAADRVRTLPVMAVTVVPDGTALEVTSSLT